VGSNVLELATPAPPEEHLSKHQYAILDRTMYGLIRKAGRPRDPRTGNFDWRLTTSRGGDLQFIPHTLYSALIHLDAGEAARQRQLIQTAFAQEGNAGHLRTGFAGEACFNCTNLWQRALIGDGGLRLHQTLGIGELIHTHRFMEQLEQSANDKVFGIVLYGPEIAGFGRNPNQNHFFFPFDEAWR
jgi:hypothetical protein